MATTAPLGVAQGWVDGWAFGPQPPATASYARDLLRPRSRARAASTCRGPGGQAQRETVEVGGQNAGRLRRGQAAKDCGRDRPTNQRLYPRKGSPGRGFAAPAWSGRPAIVVPRLRFGLLCRVPCLRFGLAWPVHRSKPVGWLLAATRH